MTTFNALDAVRQAELETVCPALETPLFGTFRADVADRYRAFVRDAGL